MASVNTPNYGLLNGLAAGLQAGLDGFMAAKKMQRDDKTTKMLMLKSGLIETDDGSIDYSPEEKLKREAAAKLNQRKMDNQDLATEINARKNGFLVGPDKHLSKDPSFVNTKRQMDQFKMLKMIHDMNKINTIDKGKEARSASSILDHERKQNEFLSKYTLTPDPSAPHGYIQTPKPGFLAAEEGKQQKAVASGKIAAGKAQEYEKGAGEIVEPQAKGMGTSVKGLTVPQAKTVVSAQKSLIQTDATKKRIEQRDKGIAQQDRSLDQRDTSLGQANERIDISKKSLGIKTDSDSAKAAKVINTDPFIMKAHPVVARTINAVKVLNKPIVTYTDAHEVAMDLASALSWSSQLSDSRFNAVDVKGLESFAAKIEGYITSNPNKPISPDQVHYLKDQAQRLRDINLSHIKDRANSLYESNKGAHSNNPAALKSLQNARDMYVSGKAFQMSEKDAVKGKPMAKGSASKPGDQKTWNGHTYKREGNIWKKVK